MSKMLDSLLDAERREACAANDEAATGLRVFHVAVKCGPVVRLAFEAMGYHSCSVVAQHAELAGPGEYLSVRAA